MVAGEGPYLGHCRERFCIVMEELEASWVVFDALA